jgi:hypothetical protein
LKQWRWVAIGLAGLVLTACTPSVQYGALQSHKYTGSPVFQTREEWGIPVSKTRFLNGTQFYQFRKPNSDCMMSAWANDLDIIYRVAVSGPETCATGS